MRKVTLLIASLLLAAPAAAQAKMGIEFDDPPETAKVGDRIDFTAMVFREPRRPTGEPKPMVGIRPLIVFESASGRTLRVRAGRTNADGTGRGSVAFPDKGPWRFTFSVAHTRLVEEVQGPIRVGTGLYERIPAADAAKPSPAGSDARSAGRATDAGFPWVWSLAAASILAAGLLLGIRRRGRWGAA